MSRLAVLAMIGCMIFNSSSEAFRNGPFAGCPDTSVQKKLSWRNYFLTPWPGQKYIAANVGIEFDRAKAVADKAALPGIDPAACYNGTYTRGRPGVDDGWTFEPMYSPGNPVGIARERQINDMQGNPAELVRRLHAQSYGQADPTKYFINVRGTTLKYTEAGEVLNSKGKIVGRLICYWHNECEKYHY